MLTEADFEDRIPRYTLIGSYFNGDETVCRKSLMFIIVSATIYKSPASLADISNMCAIVTQRLTKPLESLLARRILLRHDNNVDGYTYTPNEKRCFTWKPSEMSSQDKLNPNFQRDRDLLSHLLSDVKRRSKQRDAYDDVQDDAHDDVQDIQDAQVTCHVQDVQRTQLLKRNFSKIYETYEYVSRASKRIKDTTKEEKIAEKLKRMQEHFLECVSIIEQDTGLKSSIITKKCPLCLDTITDPYVTTACGHLVCGTCVPSLEAHSATERNYTRVFDIVCPECRSLTDFIKLYL